MTVKESENLIDPQREPVGWRYTTRGLACRLFLTCWLIYGLHFSTNIVREIYPAVALGDHFSFRLDEYANLHPDLFDKPGYGWHSGNNPGVSMLAAIPYFIVRPLIDRVAVRVRQKRQASGLTEPPEYDSPWPLARQFYKEAWRRGLDVKLGLAAFVMHAFCMAPVSALGVVAMFYLLRRIFGSDRKAFWLALLYGFGTPVFFRTGFLNHNLMLGHFVFMGFLAMWNPGQDRKWSSLTRFFIGGLTGGTAFLFDNSGVVLLLGLFFYGLAQRWRMAPDDSQRLADVVRHGFRYFLGTLPPVGLLWFYQWQSFGHPLYPGQHWMPPVEWIDLGYQGFGWPQLSLLLSLAFDYRYGLFVVCPLFLLSLFAFYVNRGEKRTIPTFELAAMIAFFVALWVFFSGVNYTRLQFNTGIRYLAPIFPFIFIPAVLTLVRLPRLAVYFIVAFSVLESWCLAMYRDVERGLGVLDPILHVFIGGFQLPALTTVSRMGDQFGEFIARGVSPLPLFALAAAILYGIWMSSGRTRTYPNSSISQSAPLLTREIPLGESTYEKSR